MVYDVKVQSKSTSFLVKFTRTAIKFEKQEEE